MGALLHRMLARLADPAPERRLRLVRLSLIATALRHVWSLPASETLVALREARGPATGAALPALSARQLTALRVLTAASLVAWLVRGRSRSTGAAAVAGYAALNAYVASAHPPMWNYNTHLHYLMAAALVGQREGDGPGAGGAGAPSAPGPASATDVALVCCQLLPGLVYLQSGLSKLVHSGVGWATSGSTLRGYTALIGTRRGRLLLRVPWLLPVLSWMTLAFELLYLPALVTGWRHRQALAAAATGFHLAVSGVMGISFWHLWSQYPSLYVLPADRQWSSWAALAAPMVGASRAFAADRREGTDQNDR